MGLKELGVIVHHDSFVSGRARVTVDILKSLDDKLRAANSYVKVSTTNHGGVILEETGPGGRRLSIETNLWSIGFQSELVLQILHADSPDEPIEETRMLFIELLSAYFGKKSGTKCRIKLVYQDEINVLKFGHDKNYNILKGYPDLEIDGKYELVGGNYNSIQGEIKTARIASEDAIDMLKIGHGNYKVPPGTGPVPGGGYYPAPPAMGGGYYPAPPVPGGGYYPAHPGTGGGYYPAPPGTGGGFNPDPPGTGGGFNPAPPGTGGGYYAAPPGTGGGYYPVPPCNELPKKQGFVCRFLQKLGIAACVAEGTSFIDGTD